MGPAVLPKLSLMETLKVTGPVVVGVPEMVRVPAEAADEIPLLGRPVTVNTYPVPLPPEAVMVPV